MNTTSAPLGYTSGGRQVFELITQADSHHCTLQSLFLAAMEELPMNDPLRHKFARFAELEGQMAFALGGIARRFASAASGTDLQVAE